MPELVHCGCSVGRRESKGQLGPYFDEENRSIRKPAANTWLCEDISLLGGPIHVEPDATPVYVSHVTRPVFYDGIYSYCAAHLEPAYSIEVDGVPILNVFRLDATSWMKAVAYLE